jgi:hypothetical protein
LEHSTTAFEILINLQFILPIHLTLHVVETCRYTTTGQLLRIYNTYKTRFGTNTKQIKTVVDSCAGAPSPGVLPFHKYLLNFSYVW